MKAKKIETNNYINFLLKYDIIIKEFILDYLILIEYNSTNYYVNLTDFSFKKQGDDTWLTKNKFMYGFDSIITFGKYKDHNVYDILIKDKQYINWLLNEANCLFQTEVLKELKK
jgi:hypothetical protein